MADRLDEPFYFGSSRSNKIRNALAYPIKDVAFLHRLVEGLNKFTQRLIISDETADKNGRTFKGLFAVLDIIRQGFSDNRCS